MPCIHDMAHTESGQFMPKLLNFQIFENEPILHGASTILYNNANVKFSF